jgi:hypothetical protein
MLLIKQIKWNILFDKGHEGNVIIVNET